MASTELTKGEEENATGGRAAARTHYVNTDFDLSLRPRIARSRRRALLRQVEELSLQGLLGAREEDRALLRCPAPEEFRTYLVECGLTLPRVLRHPEVDPATEFRPFGWNDEAIELNRRHARPSPHPGLPVVRRVNARSFAAELERDLGLAVAPSRIVESEDQLESFLEAASTRSTWVIKAEQGNAGLANRRLAGGRWTPGIRRFVTECLAEDDRLLVERWLPRERDWCTVFRVPFRAADLRIHESICTDGGALVGALFRPGGADRNRWTDRLATVAERIASRLEREGYFGPVCLDSFTWSDRGAESLRVLVDLNCRRSMTDRAHALWNRLAPDRTLYYRFFNRGKLALPEGLHAVLGALGPRRYDPSSRRGILLVSPPWPGDADAGRTPAKLAVVFAAARRAEIFEQERWFRETFEG